MYWTRVASKHIIEGQTEKKL